jgi:glycosyl transferase family 2
MMAPSTHCHVLVDRITNHHHNAGPSEILVFATCRDERLRLPAFLEHYRGLGVDRFFIVDNDSSDGTPEYLADQPDVRLFGTANRYSEARNGIDWLNALLGEFGVGSWCLTVDIDELLVYPGSERVSLHTLTQYLDHNGFEALACVLLDLYPSGPLKECRYNTGDDLFDAAPYFDAGPYEKSPVDLCPGVLIRGGMRERIFYPEFRSRRPWTRIYDAMCDHVALRMPRLREMPWIRASRRRRPPCLTKIPLIRWDEKSTYLNIHWVSPKAVAPETGALLHFKFLHDFHDRARQESARGEHYDGASEYQKYAETLRQNPELTLSYAGSMRFEGPTQLVRLGLMQDTEMWADARVRGR